MAAAADGWSCDDVPPLDAADGLRAAGQGATSRVMRVPLGGAVHAVKYFVPQRRGVFSGVGDVREAMLQSVAAARNPFVAVPLGRCDNVGGLATLVMEYMPGGDLTNVTNLNGVDLFRLALQLAEGLARMHARGVYHHDIKPANVALDRRPDGSTPFRAKFIDFGHACRPAIDIPCILPYATPVLFPPEIHFDAIFKHKAMKTMEEGQLQAAADVYALGVTLLHAAGIDIVKGLGGERVQTKPYHEVDLDDGSRAVMWWPPLEEHLLDGGWPGLKGDVAAVLHALLQPHPWLRPTARETVGRLWVVGEAYGLAAEDVLGGPPGDDDDDGKPLSPPLVGSEAPPLPRCSPSHKSRRRPRTPRAAPAPPPLPFDV